MDKPIELSQIGEGGFGDVFELFAAAGCAVKMPKRTDDGRVDLESLESLIREKRFLEALTSDSPGDLRFDGIVRFLGYAGPQKATDLSSYKGNIGLFLKRQNSLDLASIDARTAVYILLDASFVLARLHGYGIVHGDVKPGNIVQQPGDKVYAELVDFGFAGVYDPSKLPFHLRRLSDLVVCEGGTLAYSAPELITYLDGLTPDSHAFKPSSASFGGEWSPTSSSPTSSAVLPGIHVNWPAADVYSAGATLWHLLRKEKPFKDAGNIFKAKTAAWPFENPFSRGTLDFGLFDLAITCMHPGQEYRPGMLNVHEQLAGIAGAYMDVPTYPMHLITGGKKN